MGSGSVGAGGNIEGSALGEGSSVTNIHEQHIHLAPARDVDVSWPVEVGPVPTLASAFQPRRALRQKVDHVRTSGTSVVLTQVFSGGGGVGKTQLAAACAIDALKEGADLVVWVVAAEAQQVITQYAQTATRIRLPGATGQDPEADAHALLEWLATTPRRWLVVLDDITDPAAVNGWWPVSRTGTGWVLATTRLKEARLSGGGRTRVDVDVYTPQEADTYLRERLAGEDMAHLLDERTASLTEALGHLPLALSHAAAYMINEELTCTAYLNLFTHRQTRLDQALPETADSEGYGRQIAATLLLSLDAVRTADLHGLAVPALRLAALLDPAGHPHVLWSTAALLNYLTTHRTPPTPDEPGTQIPQVSPEQTHTVLRLLHRYALLTCDTRTEPRAVRIHALTARAVRETITADQQGPAAVAAAGALRQIWPEVDQLHPDLAATLRANTDALADHTLDDLWHPDARGVLYQAGGSLVRARLDASAATYWQILTTDSERLLGSEDPATLTAHANLAVAYQQAGRTAEAIEIKERMVTDCERLLGSDHPHTLTAHSNLAASYQQAGRTAEAIEIEERVATDCERLLGSDHPHTLTAHSNLAASYWQAGRTGEAIELLEQVVADSERLLGSDHPDTLTARGKLATSYWQAGRTDEAIELLQQVVADSERLLGNDHPDTLTARGKLATSYQQAERTDEATELLQQVVADSERLLGSDHLSTLTARSNLAVAYQQAGRTDEATELLQRVVTDRERLLGSDHPDTLTARSNLAVTDRQTGRTGEATEVEERVVADCERLLGSNHPHTLTARSNLAVAYQQTGRTNEAIELMEQVVADSERLLGSDHPDTLTPRAVLATYCWQAGRTDQAIEVQKRVLGDRERLLGSTHPHTLTARSYLAAYYWEAGRADEAIEPLEQVVADRERLPDSHSPHTFSTRINLAAAYWQAGRTDEATELVKRVVTDSERLPDSDSPDTIAARSLLAASYWQAGRTDEAIELVERVVTDSERLLGSDHPETLSARASLATFCQQREVREREVRERPTDDVNRRRLFRRSRGK
ncbi:FxSxx-COOH system tetratricopeptide repeat protein [Streptomyces sp. NBC_01390]|uniref:FxSxx-COOH system tetratricopeptide repeat protein n=1 Tax=Streptomyces sp. NBC_01390 TaxID=2903850 RepID=UPI003252CE26